MSFLLPALGALAPIGAAAIGGALNYSGAHNANQMSKKMAREQMAFQRATMQEQMGFQERMSNTAYQRAVEDMRAAGINPILAFNQGGASSPAGSAAAGATAPMQNEMSGAVSSAVDAMRSFQELKSMKLQNAKTIADTELTERLANKAHSEKWESVSRRLLNEKQFDLLDAQLTGAEIEKEIDETDYGKFIRYLQRLNPISGGAKKVSGIFK